MLFEGTVLPWCYLNRLFRLRLFIVDEQQNIMCNDKYLYARDPLFLSLIISAVSFCLLLLLGFFVDVFILFS